MANFITTLHIGLIDANGNKSKMSVDFGQVPEATTITAVNTIVAAGITALGAPGTITNCKVTDVSWTVLVTRASADGAVDAEYSTVNDGARLTFDASDGGQASSTIPAPVAAIFGATPNENTVDPTSAVSTWIAFMEGHEESQSVLTNVYRSGVKTGRHAPRRAQHRVV